MQIILPVALQGYHHAGKLIAQHDAGDDTRKDIHEDNTDYLRRSGAAAEYCSRNLGWKTVSCSRDGELKTIEEIHREIMGKAM